MSSEPIISPDTQRDERIPPRQVLTRKWPVLHYGSVPAFNPAAWDFTVFPEPLVHPVKRWTWREFTALPRVKVFADMHCVTRWSKLDNLWEGVATREILNHVKISEKARFVMVHCEFGFTTNMPIEDFLGEDCLFALKHGEQDLEPDHGYPLRLVIPKLYAWKSAKWVRGIEFLERDEAGFWESWEHGGYHMYGDPWLEQRFRDHE
ncbi:MAG: sulfite oxidase-like oxidoreductase [Planctomycetes bacterium]|nr:sulfite oxidase-like oxidoreductase [Planctomycetota bacterium]